MFKFLHHLLEPHCSECKEEKDDANICYSCETFARENERLRAENERLLNYILDKPAVLEVVHDKDIKPIMPKGYVPFRVQRQMREAEDRQEARLRAESAKPEIDKLEEEIVNAAE